MTLYYFYFDGKYNFDDVESFFFSGKQFIRLDDRQISMLSSIPTKHMKFAIGSHMDEIVYAKVKFRILDSDTIKLGTEKLVSSHDIYESVINRYEKVKNDAINKLIDKSQCLTVKSIVTKKPGSLAWSDDNPNEYTYMQGNYVIRRGELLDLIRDTIKGYPGITVNKVQFDIITSCWVVTQKSRGLTTPIYLEGYEGVVSMLGKILITQKSSDSHTP